ASKRRLRAQAHRSADRFAVRRDGGCARQRSLARPPPLRGAGAGEAPHGVPSLGRHHSVRPARESRHSASAPPRDARYNTDESGADLGAPDRAVGSGNLVARISSEMLSPIGTLHNTTFGLDTVATSRLGFPG